VSFPAWTSMSKGLHKNLFTEGFKVAPFASASNHNVPAFWLYRLFTILRIISRGGKYCSRWWGVKTKLSVTRHTTVISLTSELITRTDLHRRIRHTLRQDCGTDCCPRIHNENLHRQSTAQHKCTLYLQLTKCVSYRQNIQKWNSARNTVNE